MARGVEPQSFETSPVAGGAGDLAEDPPGSGRKVGVKVPPEVWIGATEKEVLLFMKVA